jgi:hypothetical protein
MAVGGNEAWNDPISMRVEYLCCTQARRGIACGNGDNGSIFSNDQIAHKWFALLGSHGKQACVLDQQLGQPAKNREGRAEGKGK